jgi:hypothetical protein
MYPKCKVCDNSLPVYKYILILESGSGDYFCDVVCLGMEISMTIEELERESR